RLREVLERHRIEVVVGKGDESKSETPQLDDLSDNPVHAGLTRLLPIGPPHRTERAVLGAAADRLHRSPHIPPRGQQVPARWNELIRADASALVDGQRPSSETVLHDTAPDDITVTAHNRVCLPMARCFVGKQRGVNAAEYHPGSPPPNL